MIVARALAVWLPAVLAGLLATGEAGAQSDAAEQQMLNHISALAMFENGCMKTAPEFEAASASFLAGGLASNGEGVWVGLQAGILAIVEPAAPGLGKSCSVGLANASFDFVVERLRDIVANQWDGRDIEEQPPKGGDNTHLFNDFTDTSGTLYSVAVGGGSDGFVSMQFNIFDLQVSQ